MLPTNGDCERLNVSNARGASWKLGFGFSISAPGTTSSTSEKRNVPRPSRNSWPAESTCRRWNSWPIEDLVSIARVAGQQDISSVDTLMDAAADERGKIFGQLPAAEARLRRVLLDKGQARTYLPKPACPQSSEIKIYETLAEHPTLHNVESSLIPSQEAVNFYTELKF